MKVAALTLGVLALATLRAAAQGAISVGTILPIALQSSINSKTARPGQMIKGKIMQSVPLPNGWRIPAGTNVLGQVVSVTRNPASSGSSVSLRFDRLLIRHEEVTIAASLRSMASFMAVHDAQVPLMGSDRGTAENSWTTLQVGGGDVVYRGGGPVYSRFGVVGKPVPGGVLVRPRAVPDGPCRGDLDGNNQLQAFWVFSSDACGLYDLPHLAIRHAGRTPPVGEVILSSSRKELRVSGGTGLLLRVVKLPN